VRSPFQKSSKSRVDWTTLPEDAESPVPWLLSIIATIGFRGVDRRTSLWRLVRALGFAGATAAFQTLGFIPAVGGIIGVAVSFWALVANFMAIRQALNVTTGRVLLVWIGTGIIEVLGRISLLIGIRFIRGS
jgi:hypothetical protein